MDLDKIYESYDEDQRLIRTKAHGIEFLTTTTFIDKYLKEVKHFAADGLSELLRDKINALNEEQFKQWFRFHLYTCEKKELIGYSNHIVCITEK